MRGGGSGGDVSADRAGAAAALVVIDEGAADLAQLRSLLCVVDQSRRHVDVNGELNVRRIEADQLIAGKLESHREMSVIALP
jgi:hypothetical protein